MSCKKTAGFWKIGLAVINLMLLLNVLGCAAAPQEETQMLDEGYDLPADVDEKEEAEAACKGMLELTFDIYEQADKGEFSNVVLSDDTIFKLQSRLKETGCSVTTIVAYSNMENYEAADRFLKDCMEGKSGSAVIYEVHSDGGIERRKYMFDGAQMFVLSARAAWNEGNRPEMTYVSYNRIKEWKYTKKGWFGYELCVPQPPKVSEIVDGSFLVRIRPMTEEQREMTESCVSGLGYQGNNLLCSDWDTDHMEELDYNGMYEYLYGMKFQGRFPYEDYSNGIPKEEFESLIMEYLPVTPEQIREYAVFDEKHQTYVWESLGCFNYGPTFFGTSLPEVTKIRENADGTVTLTVDAVCDMILCNDAVITHELTVRFAQDGSFQYLGNRILNHGIQNIPDYQYRISRDSCQPVWT